MAQSSTQSRLTHFTLDGSVDWMEWLEGRQAGKVLIVALRLNKLEEEVG